MFLTPSTTHIKLQGSRFKCKDSKLNSPLHISKDKLKNHSRVFNKSKNLLSITIKWKKAKIKNSERYANFDVERGTSEKNGKGIEPAKINEQQTETNE